MNTIFRKIGFFTAFIIPILVITGFCLGDYWNFLTIGFAFILMPVVDHLSGIDQSNVPEADVKKIGEEFYYRFITYLWTYFQIAFVIGGAWVVTLGRLPDTLSWIGFLISFSLVTGGVGITIAHELGHKKSTLDKFYAKTLLMTVCYMHYYIEHNRGHHVLVATPDDPATARKHQTFYSFWIQSVFIGFKHAWKLEADRLDRKNLSLISYHNEMLRFVFLPLAFCAFLFAGVSLWNGVLAWEIPVFFFAQSFLAITLLELVNYVEHYGILRKEIAPGKFERVNPLHSWNASHILSNFFLFQVQRHSDHHAFAHKRYQVLNHYDESPQLPFGYPTMIILAMIPPLWFSLMNKRLEHWEAKTPSATNH
jgi:alkane 1-monooxygenase